VATGRWLETAPLVLGNALAVVAPSGVFADGEEFLAWFAAGPPPIQLYCATASSTGRKRHRVKIATDEAGVSAPVAVDHEDLRVTRPIAATPEARNDCVDLADALQGSAHDLGDIFGHPKGTKAQALRTVWLAVRYLRSDFDLGDVAPLLAHGPEPELAAKPRSTDRAGADGCSSRRDGGGGWAC
jgi:hypothetical protein